VRPNTRTGKHKERNPILLDHILRLGRTLGASLQLDESPMNKGKNVNPKL
jgi:hypothetical protein